MVNVKKSLCPAGFRLIVDDDVDALISEDKGYKSNNMLTTYKFSYLNVATQYFT